MDEKSSKKEYKEGDIIRVGKGLYEFHENLGTLVVYICAYCGKGILPATGLVLKNIEGRGLDTYHRECVDLVI